MPWKNIYLSSLFVCIAILIYGTTFSYFTILKHYCFQSNGWDLGIYMQALYTTAFYGRPLEYTLEHESNPANSIFGIHFSPFLFFLAPLYRLFPFAETLLILQSFIIALGSLVAYRLSFFKLESRTASVVISLAYLLSIQLHQTNWFDFHLEAFIPVLVLLTYYYYVKKKFLLSYTFFLLALSTFEIMPVLLSPFGIYIIIRGLGKKKDIVYGFLIIATCAAWFIVATNTIYVFNPMRLSSYQNPWKKWGDSPVNIVLGILTDPIEAIRHIFTYHLEAKGFYILSLLLPLMFVPLYAPLEFILLTLPWMLMAFLSEVTVYYMLQYGSFLIGQLYITTIHGFSKIKKADPGLTLFKNYARNIFIASVLIFSMAGPFSLILLSNPDIYSAIYVGGFPVLNEHKELLRSILEMIPENASVLTQNDIVPHLANRLQIFSFTMPSVPPDYIVLDFRSKWVIQSMTVIRSKSTADIAWKFLKNYKYSPLVSADGILLFKLGKENPIIDLPHVFRFDYKNLYMDECGSIIFDATSESEKVVIFKPSNIPSILWYGPYVPLFPGNYEAVIRVKIKGVENKGFLLVEIVDSSGEGIIARKDVQSYELHESEWYEIKVDFSLSKPAKSVEVRGWVYLNTEEIILDYVELRSKHLFYSSYDG
ncbi:DUF2079 domain-containing protein [Candidatus Bathyarchaeota archaeon]|nr:DUF2079 domain-containing protein [Candidatus Bathyarchaeota archaeon]